MNKTTVFTLIALVITISIPATIHSSALTTFVEMTGKNTIALYPTISDFDISAVNPKIDLSIHLGIMDNLDVMLSPSWIAARYDFTDNGMAIAAIVFEANQFGPQYHGVFEPISFIRIEANAYIKFNYTNFTAITIGGSVAPVVPIFRGLKFYLEIAPVYNGKFDLSLIPGLSFAILDTMELSVGMPIGLPIGGATTKTTLGLGAYLWVPFSINMRNPLDR